MADIGTEGYIRIANEPDRISVATILFKNGYTVRTVRTKRNGKTYEYFVKYSRQSPDDGIGGEEVEGQV